MISDTTVQFCSLWYCGRASKTTAFEGIWGIWFPETTKNGLWSSFGSDSSVDVQAIRHQLVAIDMPWYSYETLGRSWEFFDLYTWLFVWFQFSARYNYQEVKCNYNETINDKRLPEGINEAWLAAKIKPDINQQIVLSLHKHFKGKT